MSQSSERLLPEDWPFASTQLFIISFTYFVPSSRNDEELTNASLVGRRTISVPALRPLMNKKNNQIPRRTNRENSWHGAAAEAK